MHDDYQKTAHQSQFLEALLVCKRMASLEIGWEGESIQSHLKGIPNFFGSKSYWIVKIKRQK